MRQLFRKRLILIMFLCLLAIPSSLALASTYKAARGDSHYQIGRGYNTPAEEIQDADTHYSTGTRQGASSRENMPANELQNEDIHPVQALRIPDGKENVSRGQSSHFGRIPYSDRDLDLLARLITAEADSESYTAKVAVGAVVLNRVKSPLFPKTIQEVIYQTKSGVYQFIPVKNGFINRPAKPDSIRAAKEALKGADPSGGALYFFETRVRSHYLHSLPVSVKLDSFTFAHVGQTA